MVESLKDKETLVLHLKGRYKMTNEQALERIKNRIQTNRDTADLMKYSKQDIEDVMGDLVVAQKCIEEIFSHQSKKQETNDKRMLRVAIEMLMYTEKYENLKPSELIELVKHKVNVLYNEWGI